MNGNSFPPLALVGSDGDGQTAPLEEAATTLIKLRDYLFYDTAERATSADSKEPASPENMVELRGFLECIHRRLGTVIAFHGGDEEEWTISSPGPAAAPGTQLTAGQRISLAGQAVRDALLAARNAARTAKGVAEDWDRWRDDLSQPAVKRATYQVLLDSQQEVEDSLTALASRLRKFVQVVNQIGKGGSGQSNAGHARRRPSGGRVIDGRPHYLPWQPPSAGRAS